MEAPKLYVGNNLGVATLMLLLLYAWCLVGAVWRCPPLLSLSLSLSLPVIVQV